MPLLLDWIKDWTAGGARRRFLHQQNPTKNSINKIPKTPTPMAAFAVALRLEGCVSEDPDRGLELLVLVVAEIVGFVVTTAKLMGLPVFGITCITVSILCCCESTLGRFALVERADIWIAIA
jgi:hypothetical protein